MGKRTSLMNGNDCKDSELGHLYYVEGKLTAGSLMLADPPGILGKYFINIGALNGSASYWTGDTWSQNGNFAWLFSAYNGSQYVDHKLYNYNVWAVRSGDVESQVPEPSILGLAGIGALAWILATYKKTGLWNNSSLK